MKIIEAMKRIKEYQIKHGDLVARIKQHCVDMDFETPVYGEQQAVMVQSWIQSAEDTLQEILRLRVAIQRTNLATSVAVDFGNGVTPTKTIAEWIHRRKDLAAQNMAIYAALTDRNLKEGSIQQSNGTIKEVKIRRYYQPRLRDEKIMACKLEPSIIDRTLEVVNAVTDVIE